MQPCPFCQSRNICVEMKPSAWDSIYEEPHVVCNECAASAPTYIWSSSGDNLHQEEGKSYGDKVNPSKS